jgi:hypothetical protein
MVKTVAPTQSKLGLQANGKNWSNTQIKLGLREYLKTWSTYPDQAGPPGKLVETGPSTQNKMGIQANWQKLEHPPGSS